MPLAASLTNCLTKVGLIQRALTTSVLRTAFASCCRNLPSKPATTVAGLWQLGLFVRAAARLLHATCGQIVYSRTLDFQTHVILGALRRLSAKISADPCPNGRRPRLPSCSSRTQKAFTWQAFCSQVTKRAFHRGYVYLFVCSGNFLQQGSLQNTLMRS